jgi:hypothetical protein
MGWVGLDCVIGWMCVDWCDRMGGEGRGWKLLCCAVLYLALFLGLVILCCGVGAVYVWEMKLR